MSSVRLFSLLVVILAVAIAAGIWGSLRKGGPQTAQPQAPELVSTAPAPSPARPTTEQSPAQPDLSTSHPLSREDIAPLYAALQKRVETYKTAHVRTRLEFPIAARNETVEAEFWFDAIRPHRFVHRAIKSTPKDKKSMSSPLIPLPYMTEISDGSQLTVITYQRKGVHKVDLTATDIASQQVVAPMTVQCATRMANPLQDLLSSIPYEERLKEMLEAKQENTSHGQETQVLFRINGEMSRAILKDPLAALLPVSNEGLKLMVLRRDTFDAGSGKFTQSVYLDADWHPYLVQTYQEVDWDGDIPMDRFLVDAPAGSTTYDVNERLRRTRRLGMTAKDLEEFRRAGNPMSATAILDLKRMKEREKGLEPSN